MVSIRLLSFTLVFILVLLVESGTHSQATILGEDGSHDLQPARKNLAKFKEGFDAAAEARNSRLRARKTNLKRGLVVTVEDYKISEYESTGKNSRKWLNGFTAFAADYHVPKSHPPKHN